MIQRSERLPQDADPTSLKSEYQNGLLLLKIEKQKASPIKNEEHKQTNTTQS
jgi:HSP20 family molecular chaperone IbpA